MAPSATEPPAPPIGARAEKTYPPARIFPVKETRFEKHTPPQPDGREKALEKPSGSAAIVIDNGSFNVRAGWSFEEQPRFCIPPIMAKYRDRKLGKTYSFAGIDCFADTTARGHIRARWKTPAGYLVSGSGRVDSWGRKADLVPGTTTTRRRPHAATGSRKTRDLTRGDEPLAWPSLNPVQPTRPACRRASICPPRCPRGATRHGEACRGSR